MREPENNMISRVAEHCFWMSRYLERAENTARVLDVNQTLLLDFDVPTEQQWKPLLIISGIHDFADSANAEAVQYHLTWETDSSCSIFSSLACARENARIIREVISPEMWERINFYHLWMQGPVARAMYEDDRNEFYSQIKRINQLLFGIAEGSMSHGEAWDFLRLGKYLERACQTARILDVKYHMLLPTPDQVNTPIDSAHWIAILKSCSGYEPFHKQRQSFEHGTTIADFLIFEPIFPRSVRRCLLYCQEASHKISGRKRHQPANEAEAMLENLVDWLSLATIDDLVKSGLHESLTSVIDKIHDIGGAISRTYFDFDQERVMEMLSGAKNTQGQMQMSS
jgi:uncharacterized alpha-E superfamily protein